MGATVPPSDNDRTVTLVLSDLVGSTALGEALDAETLRTILDRYFDDMRGVFTAHGGVIEKIIGDAVVAVFDDVDGEDNSALAAARAVRDARSALNSFNDVVEGRWGIRLANRTGIATDTLTVERLEAGHSVLTGSVMDMAEALEKAAPHLEALCDETTMTLIGDEGAFEPVADPPGAWRLLSVTEGQQVLTATDSDTGAGTGLEGTRRTVTVVFADPRPNIGPDAGPAAVAEAMARCFDALRTTLERHGATVETFIGDAVMAVYGLPIRHEDDALRAVTAANEMRRVLADLNESMAEELGVTMDCAIGVNTGEVVTGGEITGQRLVTGDVVNVAARLEQAAGVGEVLIGGLTHRLVRDSVDAVPTDPLVLKGKAQPVPAFSLRDVASADASSGRGPLVGREEELDLLDGALASAQEGACSLVFVTGDAGVGKTRLLTEFQARVAASGAQVATGRCLPYGDGITFWPVNEVARALAGATEADTASEVADKVRHLVGPEHADVADRVASMMGLTGETFPVSESFWAFRRLCEIVAADGPLVVRFDDLHWAEKTFLELIDHAASIIEGVPVVFVCAARPTIFEAHSDWPTSPTTVRLDLQPMGADQVDAIIANALGGHEFPEQVRHRVTEASQGNPLFAEQLISSLIDEGLLERHNGRWVVVGDLEATSVPPTIHALLASRIDRLGVEERQVVEPASVVGRFFPVDALRHLLDDSPQAQTLGEHLGALATRRVVEAAGADAYSFVHLMLRDAAYAGLLKETRAVLHERMVEWGDRTNEASGRAQEFEEILGFHLEQAYRYRTELGPVDEHAVALGLDGSRRLGSAGNRAFARGDMPAAASLLTRSADLLADDHPDLPSLLLRAGEAKFETGDFDDSAAALERAADLAAASGDRGGEAAARTERLRVAYLTGTAGSTDEVQATAAELLRALEDTGHEHGLARIWRLRAMIEAVAARFGPAEEAALRMVAHAARAGDEVLEIRTLQNIAAIAHIGPTPVSEATAICEEILERVESDRRASANTRRSLAQLHAMAADIDGARELYQGVRATLDELGWRHDAALVSLDSGPIELLAGDPAIAEAELRRDYDALTEMGDEFFKPTTAAYLAEALLRQGRVDDARALAEESSATADPDDVWPQVVWRGVLARIEAGFGDHNALHRAREAVSLAETSDAPTLQGDAYLALAEVAAVLGDTSTVEQARKTAISRYEAKGSTAGVGRVNRLVT